MDNQIWSPSAAGPVASHRQLRLFALNGTDDLGREISNILGHSLSAHEEREFEDGEHKARPLDPVSGADVYVIHSLHGGPEQSANDKLCRLLFFIGALKDAGARRVTAVAPYLCYSRKDRRTKANDPVTTRYVAALFEAIGCDAVVTLEVHNETAFENAFRCRAVALTAAPLMIDRIRAAVGNEPLCVISPDLGGGKRADLLREALEAVLERPIGKAFAEKHRSGGVVSGDLFVGDVDGATCIIIDDLISTGGTLVRAARGGAGPWRPPGRGVRCPWFVHAGCRNRAGRSGHRSHLRHRRCAAVPATHRPGARQARNRAGRTVAGGGDPPAA